MVGNIVEERPYGPGGKETRRGTKHFAPGTRVYCFPPLWGDGYEQIKVVGRHRGSSRLVTMVIPSKWVVNRRAKLVYSPAVIRRLEGHWDGSAYSRHLAEQLAAQRLDHPRSPRTSWEWAVARYLSFDSICLALVALFGAALVVLLVLATYWAWTGR
jgi:hypothetical protein